MTDWPEVKDGQFSPTAKSYPLSKDNPWLPAGEKEPPSNTGNYAHSPAENANHYGPKGE